jgi:hypothetical protein
VALLGLPHNFFYSNEFYQQTMEVSPEAHYDFSVAWMDSYLKLINSTSSAGGRLEDITNTSEIDSHPEENDQASDAATYLGEF